VLTSVKASTAARDPTAHGAVAATKREFSCSLIHADVSLSSLRAPKAVRGRPGAEHVAARRLTTSRLSSKRSPCSSGRQWHRKTRPMPLRRVPWGLSPPQGAGALRFAPSTLPTMRSAKNQRAASPPQGQSRLQSEYRSPGRPQLPWSVRSAPREFRREDEGLAGRGAPLRGFGQRWTRRGRPFWSRSWRKTT
jgi:hypothetical protein